MKTVRIKMLVFRFMGLLQPLESIVVKATVISQTNNLSFFGQANALWR